MLTFIDQSPSSARPVRRITMLRHRTAVAVLLGILSTAAFGQSTKPVIPGEGSTLRPPGYKPVYKTSDAGAVKRGKALFNDASLSTNGRSCGGCHQDVDSFGTRFKTPYPHAAMNSKYRFGVDALQLDEVIQVCLQGPLRNVPLEWGSPELTDMTTYLLKVQSTGRM
jgi:cytochrome c peroxidase